MSPNIPADKLNLMGMYFTYGRNTYKIIGQIRGAIFSGKKIDISYADILAAQKEIADVRQQIDESTPEFAQDLNQFVFGKDPVRSVMMIKGNFLGKEGIENTILPIDLGTNPWLLYQGRENFDTLDTKLTIEKTSEYLDQNRQDLVQKGITGFDIKESAFYYFRDKDLIENFGNGSENIDFCELVRYMVNTHGYVGTEKVSKPSEQEYGKKAIIFTSYRQKQSLLEKTIRELCQLDPYENVGDIISDWGANKASSETEAEARAMGKTFSGLRELGRFQINIVHVDNYYDNPKPTGFKSYNFALQVSSPRHPSTVREMLIYDLKQHRNAEIDENNPAYHEKFRKSQVDSRRKKRGLISRFEYDSVLELMFGTERMVVHLAPGQ